VIIGSTVNGAAGLEKRVKFTRIQVCDSNLRLTVSEQVTESKSAGYTVKSGYFEPRAS